MLYCLGNNEKKKVRVHFVQMHFLSNIFNLQLVGSTEADAHGTVYFFTSYTVVQCKPTCGSDCDCPQTLEVTVDNDSLEDTMPVMSLT